MSVLLDLPSELFYQIVHEWIDPTLFLAFTHLDYAVKCNSNLRLMLLNQFTATKELFDNDICFKDINFDWATGYYCDSLKEQTNNVNMSSFVGIHLLVKNINWQDSETNMPQWIRCCEMKHLNLFYPKDLLLLSEIALLSVESIEFYHRINRTDSDIWLALTRCRALRKLSCKNDDNSAMLDVVGNNINTLTELKIEGTEAALVVIANCKILEKLVLNTDKTVLLGAMLELIAQLPLLTYCAIDGDCRIVWSRKDFASKECDEIRWAFRTSGTLQSNMQILLKYFKSTTTAIKFPKYYSVPLVASVLQSCTSLRQITISDTEGFVDCFENVTQSLEEIDVEGGDLNSTIQILNCCKSVTEADFSIICKNRVDAITQIKQCIQDRNITVTLSCLNWGVTLINENGTLTEEEFDDDDLRVRNFALITSF